MEQVDQIIITTLRDIGIEIDSDRSSLKQFSTLLIVKSVARCLNIINGDKKLGENLPENMAGRYRVGIELAESCKKLGYKGDLGYETFLYSSNVEIRRLLMFLAEKLPRSRHDAEDSDVCRTSSLHSAIANEMRRQLQLPWLPPQCHSNYLVWDGNKKNGFYHYVGGIKRFSSKNLYISPKAPCLGLQCPTEQLLPSLLELSSKLTLEQDVSSITFTKPNAGSSKHKLDVKEIIQKAVNDVVSLPDLNDKLTSKMGFLDIKPVETEHNIFKITENILYNSKETCDGGKEADKVEDVEELLRHHEEEKQGLNETLSRFNAKLENAQSKISVASKKLEDLEKSKTEKEEEIEKLKETYILKKKTLQLVPSDKNAVTAMEDNVREARTVYQTMKDQWITKESTLQHDLQVAEAKYKTRELQTTEFIEDIRHMKEEIINLVSSIESKDETLAKLQVEADNLPNNVKRSKHTDKILEMVSRIKKQKEHINQIIKETKSVQKEINSLNGKIERSFIETDEMIFQDAKNNDQCRQAYKLLANLQSEFTALVRGLDDIGVINRELRDIEDSLQREKEKNISEQISRMSKDLKAVISDNDNMISAVKKFKAQKRG